MKSAADIPSFCLSPLQSAPALPGQYRIALKTWFSPAVLEAAHAMIRRRQINSYLFFRNSAGLITSDDVTATINCMPGTTRRHAFVFRDGWCGSCVAGRHGHRCKHVAAVALLCLREKNDKILPLPLSFDHSPWHAIGNYLGNQAAGGRSETSWNNTDDTCSLQVQKKEGFLLRASLSQPAAAELQALGLENTHPPSSPRAGYALLRQQLIETAITDTERQLLARGRTGQKLHRDSSALMWSARLFFLHLDPTFILTTDSQGLYQLRHKTEPPVFTLTLQRQHTWELLKSLGPEQFGIQPVDRATPFSKVCFGEQEDTIVVEHWCRLSDGREMALADLEKYHYGNHYIYKNQSFFLAPLAGEQRIEREKKKSEPLSLFSYAATIREKKKEKNTFTIQRDKIPDFLEANTTALQADIHQVAPEIRQLAVVREPDLLELTEYAEDRDWCYLAGYYRIANQRISLFDLLTAMADNKQYIPGQKWLDLEGSSLRWFHALGRERLLQDGRIRLTREELLLLGCQLPAIAEEQATIAPGSVLDFIVGGHEDDRPAALPKINAHLRQYQAHGVHWLYDIHRHGLGGILADDMGLGKTHQALALIELIASGPGRILIVCPAAVLYHWPEKQEKFFPDLSLAVHHGPERNFGNNLQKNIMVTTYGILRRDIDRFADHCFKLIFFDEMHYLKNKKTELYHAAEQLQAETIFGLSGTPLENSVEEVQTLLGICLPSLFTFPPVQKIFKRHKTQEQRHRIRKIIHPFILRRTRDQVLAELPTCSEDIRFCTLHPDQVKPYRQVGELARGMLKGTEANAALYNFSHILTAITRLKQICDHVCLLEGCSEWEKYGSGKWTEFTRLMEQCLQSELKVVVFSQFTSMLDIIEAWLDSGDIDHISIRGKIDAKERARSIKRFNTDPSCRVCCASLLAGGTGIDLTGAQVVIHYDRWWNPAKEEQATARVHRMGQQHPVQVYKLVTVGTLEEKIHGLIAKKKNLANELIGEDEGSVLKNISREELAGLFQCVG
ncbi:MAG TPA: DEAD/DEAH box helicase [Desulfobulbus sp.]|nr:DEAD/DEAH box helicase [Desulfobulbus sp.]